MPSDPVARVTGPAPPTGQSPPPEVLPGHHRNHPPDITTKGSGIHVPPARRVRPDGRGVPGSAGRPPSRPSWRRACLPGRGSRSAASRPLKVAERSTGFWSRWGGCRRRPARADYTHSGELNNSANPYPACSSPPHKIQPCAVLVTPPGWYSDKETYVRSAAP